jgi:hypothetical protein
VAGSGHKEATMPRESATAEAKVAWSVQTVGEAAGQVWATLRRLGRTNVGALEREVGAPAALTHMAIGWLAREGKVEIQPDKRSTAIWLVE